MSKLEDPMTEAFWNDHANRAFISEYCLVRRDKKIDCGGRWAGAVILPDQPHRFGAKRGHPATTKTGYRHSAIRIGGCVWR
jgi:hypothetical protein